ncbi:SDR family NAD(P)-dependent oxidoreductase [Pseudophaeobacter arcticus]|jgi:NAD(P)-dependent dehydrogenase (short-subunit alcohol dehydrogenase family)|uniref:SDR family NAD(P)-dependent oxidoreductase n=1 Tax=Pseudophaeobacter arcticus TaxID=385492 RepID=UPI0039E69ECB
MLIDGQIALVTGGGSGLGAATARLLAAQGARVAILDFDITRANDVAAEIGGVAVQADVSDEAAVSAAIDSAVDQLGGVPRIAISCAGVGMAARIVGREGKLSFDVFEKTLKVNLFGTYNVMSHAVRRMTELEPLDDGERGVVINTASVAFEDGQLGQAAYAASKGAIASMCLPAAREFAQSGIRVMAIAPGLFQTPMMEGLPPEIAEKITANIPFPARLGAPEEFALLAQQIISNPFLNGTTIRLDGAVRLPPR